MVHAQQLPLVNPSLPRADLKFATKYGSNAIFNRKFVSMTNYLNDDVQLTSDFRSERAKLQQQLDMLHGGKLATGEQMRMRLVDTTQETKAELQAGISELDDLISEYDPRLN